MDAETCVDDSVALVSNGDGGWWQWEEGFLNVDGERVVVSPQCNTGCTEDEFDTITEMAESITFTRDK